MADYSYFSYLCVYLFSGYLICGRKRHFDLYSIVFLSSSYYSIPLFIGSIVDPNDKSQVAMPSEIYASYAIFFFLTGIFALLADFGKVRIQISNFSNLKSYSKDLGIVTSFLFLVIVILHPRGLLPANVDEHGASQLGVVWVLYRLFAISFFATAIYEKSYLRPMSIFFLLTTLTSGSRSFFVAALLIYICYLYHKDQVRIIAKPFFIFGLPFGVMALTIYKVVYQYLLVLDFNSLRDGEQLLSQIIFKTYDGSEAIVTLSFVHGISLWKNGQIYEFSNILINAVPMLSETIGEIVGKNALRFSDVLEPLYFDDVSYGVASNLWGSMYASTGLIGTTVLMIVYLATLYLYSVYSRVSRQSFLFTYPILVLLAFYATRWELDNVIYMLVASYGCYFLFVLFRFMTRSSRLSKLK